VKREARQLCSRPSCAIRNVCNLATFDPALSRTRIVASYSPHEREARTKGVPIRGSGRIFPVPEASITCEQREFPPSLARIGGMDFGWDHPFAAVELDAVMGPAPSEC
jgi:hypothetical protein